jgi:hypothetical protein
MGPSSDFERASPLYSLGYKSRKAMAAGSAQNILLSNFLPSKSCASRREEM